MARPLPPHDLAESAHRGGSIQRFLIVLVIAFAGLAGCAQSRLDVPSASHRTLWDLVGLYPISPLDASGHAAPTPTGTEVGSSTAAGGLIEESILAPQRPIPFHTRPHRSRDSPRSNTAGPATRWRRG
jgi:hypothetical protein